MDGGFIGIYRCRVIYMAYYHHYGIETWIYFEKKYWLVNVLLEKEKIRGRWWQVFGNFLLLYVVIALVMGVFQGVFSWSLLGSVAVADNASKAVASIFSGSLAIMLIFHVLQLVAQIYAISFGYTLYKDLQTPVNDKEVEHISTENNENFISENTEKTENVSAETTVHSEDISIIEGIQTENTLSKDNIEPENILSEISSNPESK